MDRPFVERSPSPRRNAFPNRDLGFSKRSVAPKCGSVFCGQARHGATGKNAKLLGGDNLAGFLHGIQLHFIMKPTRAYEIQIVTPRKMGMTHNGDAYG